jgi:CBS domain-containing protein
MKRNQERSMKASDIMTSPVITVAPRTPVANIAALLAMHRISAVPVVKKGHLVGLVSEADLLHRHEIGTDRTAAPASGWRRFFRAERAASDYTKSHARRARDVMTRDVVCIEAGTPVGEIVELLEQRKVKRLPVLRGKELVGIVSRADLVRALAKTRPAQAPLPGNDEAIRRLLIAELERQPWWRSPSSNILVENGVVHYWGIIDSYDERNERSAARVAAENVAGVRAVNDHRVTRFDVPAMS